MNRYYELTNDNNSVHPMNRPYSTCSKGAAWSICELTDIIKLVSNFLHAPSECFLLVRRPRNFHAISITISKQKVFYLHCEEVVITTYYISLLRLHLVITTYYLVTMTFYLVITT